MSVQIPPPSTGPTIETNSPNGTDQRQVVSLGDTVDNYTADVNSEGAVLIGGVISDTPDSFIPGDTHRMSLTSDGRLRVSAAIPDNNRAWQSTFDNPWDDDANDIQFTPKGISYV